jgi:hypothetical protein
LTGFKRDHLRRITELGDILAGMGRTPPKEGYMKALLTKGKVVVAGLTGDEAILQAMRPTEARRFAQSRRDRRRRRDRHARLSLAPVRSDLLKSARELV